MKTPLKEPGSDDEKHNLSNLVVSLHDAHARILWASSDPCNERGWVGRCFREFWVGDDHATQNAAIDDCVMRGQIVGYVVNTSFGPNMPDVLWRVTLIPADTFKVGAVAALIPGLSFVCISSRLPAIYAEITTDDKILLSLLCADHTLREIAEKMFLSESAIDSKIKKLKDKLGARTIGGLVGAAMGQFIASQEASQIASAR